LEIKVKHAREFLEKGHRVQFSVFFRGRQMLHKEQGNEMLTEIMASLQDLAKIDRPSMMTGRRMTLLVASQVILTAGRNRCWTVSIGDP